MIRSGEDQLPAGLEHAVELRKRVVTIEQMREGFAEPHDVEGSVAKRHSLFRRSSNEMRGVSIASRAQNRIYGNIRADHLQAQLMKEAYERAATTTRVQHANLV